MLNWPKPKRNTYEKNQKTYSKPFTLLVGCSHRFNLNDFNLKAETMNIDLKTIFKILITALLFSFILLSMTSCDITKNARKSKSESDFSENIENRSFRKGDTVHYEIPRVTYKDTTIYRTNRQGTTIKTVYDQTGNITSIDCFASAIEEIRKENRQFWQSLLDKNKVKTETFDPTFILYIMGGIVLIVFFALFLMFLYIKKNTATVTAAINKITT